MRNGVFLSFTKTTRTRLQNHDGSKPLVWGAAATACAAAVAWGIFSTHEDEHDTFDNARANRPAFEHLNTDSDSSSGRTPTLLSMSPAESPPVFPPQTAWSIIAPQTPPGTTKPINYDFLVVGHGNAGRSALNTLRRRCPAAKIAVIDPLRPCFSSDQVDFWAQSVAGFQPAAKSVRLSSGQELRYRRAILVATGARGAPPPKSLFDKHALDRVLELRPTQTMEKRDRPVLPPLVARQLALTASSQGATVGVLGSGWEAVELAVAASKAGKSSVLTFGSAGPLSHVLPRYLSTAVTRRLRKEGIQVSDRSLIRYVGNDRHSFKAPKLELHTGKSYDLIDTQRNFVDLLVVAPNVDGPRGTAILPSSNHPQLLQDYSIAMGQPWYQSVSQMASGDTMVCYADDGRLVVNAELSAASHVYAAGSVAKYPNSLTGHAQVAGEGSVDGAIAGEVAAIHMSRDYYECTPGSRPDDDDGIVVSFASESFPIWRSDMCSYLSDEEAETSALHSVGIQALCVGLCDSERMATHGFWWTNQAVNRRLTREALESGKTRRPTRRRTNRNKHSPVYGTGVVFYFDRTGKICGIMTWGLPFAAKSMDGRAVLKKDLVNRLKAVIRSDGGVIESLQDDLLKTSHLVDESKHIVSLALDKRPPAARPLYRYTASKPPSITSVGMLKRKDQTGSGELLGENLYVQKDIVSESRPQSLVYVYPMEGDSVDVLDVTARAKAEQVERAWHGNELRARPPKEEPLWLRKGDAHKMINFKQAMADMAEANLKAGKFSDGTDPVQQAKVPQAYLNAKQTMREWIHPTVNTENNKKEFHKQEQSSDMKP